MLLGLRGQLLVAFGFVSQKKSRARDLNYFIPTKAGPKIIKVRMNQAHNCFAEHFKRIMPIGISMFDLHLIQSLHTDYTYQHKCSTTLSEIQSKMEGQTKHVHSLVSNIYIYMEFEKLVPLCINDNLTL